MICLLFILILGTCYATKEKSCGCGISRHQDSGNHNINFFGVMTEKETAQCQIDCHPGRLGAIPEAEMILVPAGLYQLGTDEVEIERDEEGPKRLVKLRKFYLDKYEVSNEEFNKFVKATGFKTEAETYGESFVFQMFMNSSFREELVDFRVVQSPWWYKVKGADWRHPYGPDSDIKDMMDHPVVHVSWTDAKAYCNWRGGRLPTEAEWEGACRAGDQDTLFPWGNKLFPSRDHMANIFQGTFPDYNSKKDGYIGTCPVDLFPQNSLGLHNMAGNVWEWVEDSWSSEQPNFKVEKGGSYMCHRTFCFRFRCSSRAHVTLDSTTGNLGFRCAKSF